MIQFDEMRRRLADPATRTRAAVEVGDWARDLCLLFGARIDTAYAVGGALAEGVEKRALTEAGGEIPAGE